jgi:hypothetical protein
MPIQGAILTPQILFILLIPSNLRALRVLRGENQVAAWREALSTPGEVNTLEKLKFTGGFGCRAYTYYRPLRSHRRVVMWVREALKRMFFAGRRTPCAARKLFLLSGPERVRWIWERDRPGRSGWRLAGQSNYNCHITNR